MYRDKTLLPAEAIRMAALGALAQRPHGYAALAREVRAFSSRIAGPSLDILGSSIELLRFEGLVAPVDGGSDPDAKLEITAAGRAALVELLTSNVRSPTDGVSKLIFALKLRFLHLLDTADQLDQLDIMAEMSEAELARLEDLVTRYRDEPGRFQDWLGHDIGQVRSRIDWLRDMRAQISLTLSISAQTLGPGSGTLSTDADRR